MMNSDSGLLFRATL